MKQLFLKYSILCLIMISLSACNTIKTRDGLVFIRDADVGKTPSLLNKSESNNKTKEFRGKFFEIKFSPIKSSNDINSMEKNISLLEQEDLIIKINTNGKYSLKLKGETYYFTIHDWNNKDKSFLAGSSKILFSFNDKYRNQFHYSNLIMLRYAPSGKKYYMSNAYLSYGEKTTDMNNINLLTNLVYKGKIVGQDNFASWSHNSFNSKIQMKINLFTNKVTGKLYEMKYYKNKIIHESDELYIKDAFIIGNKFKGKLKGNIIINNSKIKNSTINGEIRGGFYGPEADEVAGEFKYSDTTNTLYVAGAFIAKK